jgi:amino acid adenylation domain-containing protein
MSSNSNRKDSIQAQLTELTADLSGYDTSDLVPTHTFLELGFDSLFMTQLATAFSKEMNVPITFRQLFDELPTLSALAAYMDAQLPEEAPVVEAPAPVAESAVEIAASTTPVVMPQVSVPAPAAGTPVSSGLAGVLAEQVKLMSEQLQLLQQMRNGQVAQAPQATAPAPVATMPQPAVEAPVASQADEKPEVKMPAGFGPNVNAKADDSITPQQRGHIRRLVERYNARTATSKKRTQIDREYHADPRTAAGFNPLWKEMVYPLVVERSKGAYLWDVDGNKYIDILNGFGPNFFGHNAPFVTEALLDQLQNSYEVGPQTPRAGETAKLLCEMTGMDRVSWVNTGSEAVQAAIRISRTVTGRDKIVVFSGDYHGNFDEVLVRSTNSAKGRRTFPQAPGIPFDSVSNVIVLDYGEAESIDVIKQHAHEIAAVLVEPVQSRRPELQPKEFLHELRALTHQEGIVLVFDEVITGFRIRQGGAQEYFGIEADLATYGKIIGGGMPIGVVAGRSKFMDTFDGGMWQYGDNSRPTAGVTFFAGTFVRHPLAITAAHASLNYLKNAGPSLQEGINRRATKMATELNTFFQEEGVNIEIPHFASQMFIRNKEENELATLMFYHMRDRGIHVLEGFPSYMTAAHTDEDVDTVVAAVKDSVHEMQADGLLVSRKDGGSAQFERKFSLTDDQRQIWLICQMGDEASCAFNESDSVIIDGDLKTDAFKKAVLETLNQHEAFKLRFDDEGESQWVDEEISFTVQETDLSDLESDAQETRLEELFAEMATTPFDLETGPLVRTRLIKTAEQQHIFALYCHHIIFDGYSANIVIDEVMNRYKASLAGEQYTDDETLPYSAYVHRRAGRNDAQQEATAYWVEQYQDGVPALIDLPTDRPRQAERQYAGATTQRVLTHEQADTIRNTAKSLGVSQNTLLLAAYTMLLSRLSNSQDFAVGVPVAGQAAEGIDTVGYCVNMLPVLAHTAFDKSFTDFIKEMHETVFNAFDHQNFSMTDLVKEVAPPRQMGRLMLMETVFNYSRYFSDIDVPGCEISTRENRRHATYYDLFFQVIESQDEMVVYVDYASALFDEATIDGWISHYIELLKDIAADANKALGDYSLGGKGDAVLHGPVAKLHGDETVLTMFEKAVKASPEATALTFGKQSFSYAELNSQANQLAHLLVQRDVSESDIVGVLQERSIDMVVTMLAIWKAGAAYLPLDPGFPSDRLNYMIEDSGTQLVLSQTTLTDATSSLSCQVLNVDEQKEDISALPMTSPKEVSINGSARAYVLYTSGSTGNPKGVENTHTAAVNFLKAMADRPGLTAKDKLLAITTISFDISILELFLPLTVGAEVVIASNEEAMDGFDIADLMEDHDITVMQATPVTWRLLLDCDWEGRDNLKALCGGEALVPALAAELLPRVGELWNMYGPTETTVWSTCELISDAEQINVGTPILNTSLYILNSEGRMMPVGVPGELWIGGQGVATGYLGRPDITTERFRDDPFNDGRMYGTGDRAVIRADGKVNVLGRNDNQVKIRGHRIELGEVESVLARHDAINQVAVTVQPDHHGEPMLAAYIVWLGSNEVTHSELRQWMRQVVPDYMLPQVFVEMTALPLTNNNKVDRNALPAPGQSAGQHREAIAPRSDTEKLIASIWQDILEIDDISVTDNFFELGGQSLQVVKMTSILRKKHGLKISPRAVIFESLEQLAALANRLAS